MKDKTSRRRIAGRLLRTAWNVLRRRESRDVALVFTEQPEEPAIRQGPMRTADPPPKVERVDLAGNAADDEKAESPSSDATISRRRVLASVFGPLRAMFADKTVRSVSFWACLLVSALAVTLLMHQRVYTLAVDEDAVRRAAETYGAVAEESVEPLGSFGFAWSGCPEEYPVGYRVFAEGTAGNHQPLTVCCSVFPTRCSSVSF
ncbi:hypothetical protein ACFL26_00420 [Patescibacteria group bacterium]